MPDYITKHIFPILKYIFKEIQNAFLKGKKYICVCVCVLDNINIFRLKIFLKNCQKYEEI